MESGDVVGTEQNRTVGMKRIEKEEQKLCVPEGIGSGNALES